MRIPSVARSFWDRVRPGGAIQWVMRWKRTGIVLAMLALGAGVMWAGKQVRAYDFVRWDDDINVLQNRLLVDPWSWDLVARLCGAADALRFKPVHWLLLRAVRAQAGWDPAAWHLVGLMLHATVAVLFALVVRRILGLLCRPDWRSDLAAIAAAVVWAVHPLRAETVGWVTASTYPLAGTLLLGSFLCYLAAHFGRQSNLAWLVAAWALAVLAYGSYPVATTFCLWLAAFDHWLAPPAATAPGWAQPGHRQWWQKQAAFALPAGIAVMVTVLTRVQDPGIFTSAPSLADVGILQRVGTALAVYAALAWKMVHPADLTPNMPPLDRGDSLTLAILLAGTVATIFVLAMTWIRRRTQPGLALAVWGGLLVSLPCLGLTELPTWPVDRYSYVLHLVWLGALAVFVRLGSARMQAAALAATLGIAIGSVHLFRQQLGIWRDSETLFTHMERHPGFAANPRQQGHVYVIWGRFEATRGNPARAAELFNRAQALYLANIRSALQRHDYAEALSFLSHQERHFGLTPVLRREKGAWLLALGRMREARLELQQAQAELPTDLRVRQLLQEASAVEAGSPPQAPIP